MGSTFKQYVERIKAGDPGVVLGSLVWYSVSESVRITHANLSTRLKKLGLEDFTPNEPRDDDVFRRVCTAAARKRVPTSDPEVFENYLVRDVSRADGQVVKHIVVERVDGGNQRLSYEPAVSLCFTSDTSMIETEILASGYPQAENLADLIRDDFDTERGSVNAYAIRELCRKAILATNATIVRPGGGVYFVMQARVDRVEALEEMAEKMDGVEVHSLPLIDDGKQRAMLRRAIEAETVDEIDSTLAEIEKLMKGPEITFERYGQMVARMNDVKSKTGEYAELLDEALGNTDFRLTQYQRAMKKLLDHVKE